MPEDLQCPKCGHTDTTQKVTAIVESGTSYRIQTSIGSHNPTGKTLPSGSHSADHVSSTQAILARKLQMPSPPKTYPSETQARVKSVAFILAGAALVMAGGGAVISSFLSEGKNHSAGNICTSLAFSSGAIFLVLGVVGLTSTPTREKGRKRVLAAQQQWEKGSSRWSNLWYCYRCDVVYLPGSGTYADSGDMAAYLTDG